MKQQQIPPLKLCVQSSHALTNTHFQIRTNEPTNTYLMRLQTHTRAHYRVEHNTKGILTAITK